MSLGFITPEITMSLGDNSLALGYITHGITQMLGSTPHMPTLVGPPLPTLVGPSFDNHALPQLVGLGQEPAPAENGTMGKIVFGVMLFAMGVSLGVAVGVSHGVKVSR